MSSIDAFSACLDAVQDHVNMAVRTLAQTVAVGSNHQLISAAETELDHISSEVARARKQLAAMQPS